MAKSILSLSPKQATDFFLDSSSYFTTDLPEYFDLQAVIDEAKTLFSSFSNKDKESMEGAAFQKPSINCHLLINKDGNYQWRDLVLLHPMLYVDLVMEITESAHWAEIQSRFRYLRTPKIICCSLALPSANTKKSLIFNWLGNVEQKSVENALSFACCGVTDITDCYPSVYTHTISWALHDETVAKANRKDHTLLGNRLDHLLQCVSYGQTSGIPQGSRIMDFIVEILLKYADYLLSEQLKKMKISHYQIIRYRDDYRIFGDSGEEVGEILKQLTLVLAHLSLKINSKKTQLSSDVIGSAVKEDKKYALSILLPRERFLQKRFLSILQLSRVYPNSGTVIRFLDETNTYIQTLTEKPKNIPVLISIVTEIMFLNQKHCATCCSILSKLLSFLPQNRAVITIKQIRKKMLRVTNTDYLDIWLQRILIAYDSSFAFKCLVCQKVCNPLIRLWDSSFLSVAFDEKLLINASTLASLTRVISPEVIKSPFFTDSSSFAG